MLIAAFGVGTTALAVLLMAAGLAADRRRGEISLLRSRGGSLRGIFRRLVTETAAAAVPAGAAGTVLALLVLPTGRSARRAGAGRAGHRRGRRWRCRCGPRWPYAGPGRRSARTWWRCGPRGGGWCWN